MISAVSSNPSLRQRLNMGAKTGCAKMIMDQSVALLRHLQTNITPCLDNLVPLDIDVSPFDNSDTKKKCLLHLQKSGRLCPDYLLISVKKSTAFIVELREGKEHSQSNTPFF